MDVSHKHNVERKKSYRGTCFHFYKLQANFQPLVVSKATILCYFALQGSLATYKGHFWLSRPGVMTGGCWHLVNLSQEIAMCLTVYLLISEVYLD